MIDLSRWPDWTLAARPYTPRFRPAPEDAPPGPDPAAPFPFDLAHCLREALARHHPEAWAAALAAIERAESAPPPAAVHVDSTP